jgi:hypothetical protein
LPSMLTLTRTSSASLTTHVLYNRAAAAA